MTTVYAYAPDAPIGPALALGVDDANVYFGSSGLFAIRPSSPNPSPILPTYGIESVRGIVAGSVALFATVSLDSGTQGLFRLRLDGTAPGNVFPIAAAVLGPLAVDGDRAFVATSTGVYAVNGDGSHVVTIPVNEEIRGLAVAAGSLFASTSSVSATPSYSVWMGNGDGDTLAKIATSDHEIDAIAVTSTHVVWAEQYSYQQPDVPTSIRRARHDGTNGETPLTLSQGLLAFSIAADEHALYYSDGATIVEVELATKTSTVLADNQASAAGLVVRGGAVYWLNQPSWKLSETPTKNGVRAACVK